LRAAADILWGFAAADPFVFTAPAAGCESFRAFAHLAFCASAIFLREAADMTRVCVVVFTEAPVPFSDSITEIA
jgi:hypothetical protein